MQETIRAKLAEAFLPLSLTVDDQSALHAGHAGARPGGETHFSVKIVSSKFQGQTRLARQRSVHAVLDFELKNGVHALTLVLQSPEEASSTL